MGVLSSLHKPIGGWTDRRLRLDRVAVENPRRYAFMQAGVSVKLAVLLLAFLGFILPEAHGEPFWLRVIIAIVCAAVLYTTAHAKKDAADSYFDGYLDGRRQIVIGLHEAQKRGMDLDEWLQAEAERQGALLVGHHGLAKVVKAVLEVQADREERP
jgi:hypothetical protein